MMKPEETDFILDICLNFYNDINIYGSDFEKLEIDRPYADIIKTGFETILDGKGADVFETIMEAEILWFMKTDTKAEKQMMFELSVFKKFWVISEKEGKKALYHFILSAISPELYQKHVSLLNCFENEQEVSEEPANEVTFYTTYREE